MDSIHIRIIQQAIWRITFCGNAIAFQKVDVRLWELPKIKVKMLKTQELNMTHQQIADELGTAREVVSRLLKQLERD